MGFDNPEVAAAFARFPERSRDVLIRLRTLIFDVAAAIEGVGPLTETLKWGQPAYLTNASKSGSTIRLGVSKCGNPAVFFICHTRLVARFREIFPDALPYDGTRAITFAPDATIDEDALAQCLAMALTFKKSGSKLIATTA